MNTSHFRNVKLGNYETNNLVSIARWPPRWWGIRRRYVTLAPSIKLLNKSKAGLLWSEYVKEYQEGILAKLDPAKVFLELGANAVLLCWEKPGEDCHRHLVAEWLEGSLKIKVREL